MANSEDEFGLIIDDSIVRRKYKSLKIMLQSDQKNCL